MLIQDRSTKGGQRSPWDLERSTKGRTQASPQGEKQRTKPPTTTSVAVQSRVNHNPRAPNGTHRTSARAFSCRMASSAISVCDTISCSSSTLTFTISRLWPNLDRTCCTKQATLAAFSADKADKGEHQLGTYGQSYKLYIWRHLQYRPRCHLIALTLPASSAMRDRIVTSHAPH